MLLASHLVRVCVFAGPAIISLAVVVYLPRCLGLYLPPLHVERTPQLLAAAARTDSPRMHCGRRARRAKRRGPNAMRCDEPARSSRSFPPFPSPCLRQCISHLLHSRSSLSGSALSSFTTLSTCRARTEDMTSLLAGYRLPLPECFARAARQDW